MSTSPPSPESPLPPGGHPGGAWVLELERQARRNGSGIGTAQLTGPWELRHLWGRERATPQEAPAALLRLLGARLAISPGDQPDEPLRLCNSVRIGALELRFLGWGRLVGRRPLLQFGFERLELGLGPRLLLQRSLPPGDPRRQPFFALIAAGSDGQGHWLLARGRGGGLACWRCPSADAGQQLAAQR
ncbi:MAG: hypothetical protein MUD04_09695 [Cyanobium sp. Prado107]|nr:hypothetical protein [Cyanobium sp. Prado107]